MLFFLDSDSKLYEWGLYGKPENIKESALSLDSSQSGSANPPATLQTNQSDAALDPSHSFNQSESTFDDVNHPVPNEIPRPCKDHAYSLDDENDITNETTIDEKQNSLSSQHGSDVQIKVGRIVKNPYAKPSLPFQGEFESEETLMQGMGLPLSFVRSPRDLDEVSPPVLLCPPPPPLSLGDNIPLIFLSSLGSIQP